MLFAGIDNAFGVNVFEPVATPTRTPYYKGMRLEKRPRIRLVPAPKPLSETIKNFLLTYDK